LLGANLEMSVAIEVLKETLGIQAMSANDFFELVYDLLHTHMVVLDRNLASVICLKTCVIQR